MKWNFKEGKKQKEKNLKDKLHIAKHRNPEQTVEMSKYLNTGVLEIISPRENFVEFKKIWLIMV